MPPVAAAALPFAAVVAAALFAWWGAWNGQYLFDDHPALVHNAPLLAGDWWNAAFGSQHNPLANRPFTCWTLAMDFALFGNGPFGPHLTNVLLHVCNGVLLLLLVRRALLAPNLAGRFTAHGANVFATALAAMWVAHPLCGEAVCYATQRSTLLFSGCLLLCLNATLRAHDSRRAPAWRGVAVLALALGMASKEDLVAGPILVLLFVRAFVVPSWRALLAHAGFFAAIASTWAVLAACLALGPHNETVGYATAAGTTAWQWLLTQAGVVAHYVRLVVWPAPLRGAYDFGIVTTIGPAVVPGLFVLALLAVTAFAWRTRPWLGFLGALFFLLLAPTSTVMPIVTEVAAERRVYLPMLFVLVPIVVAARTLLVRAAAPRFAGAVATAAAVIALGLVSRQRVAAHANEPVFWADAYAKRDPASRTALASQILSNHGWMLLQTGRAAEAHPILDIAVQCERPTLVVRSHHAVSLQQRGRHAEAVAALEQVLQAAPAYAEAAGALGTCLLQEADRTGAAANDPRLARAEQMLRAALELEPHRHAMWNSLGYALQRRGDWSGAERAYLRAIELSSARTEPFLNRADALAHLGRTAEIQPMFDRLLAARPRDVQLRCTLADGARARGNFELTKHLLRDALRIDPANAQIAAALRQIDGGEAR